MTTGSNESKNYVCRTIALNNSNTTTCRYSISQTTKTIINNLRLWCDRKVKPISCRRFLLDLSISCKISAQNRNPYVSVILNIDVGVLMSNTGICCAFVVGQIATDQHWLVTLYERTLRQPLTQTHHRNCYKKVLHDKINVPRSSGNSNNNNKYSSNKTKQYVKKPRLKVVPVGILLIHDINYTKKPPSTKRLRQKERGWLEQTKKIRTTQKNDDEHTSSLWKRYICMEAYVFCVCCV